MGMGWKRSAVSAVRVWRCELLLDERDAAVSVYSILVYFACKLPGLLYQARYGVSIATFWRCLG
jgi:hypothetical protein